MNHSKKFCQCSGFTMLELMTVVVLIGVLSAVALPRVFNTSDRGHVGAAQYDLTSIRHALAAYAAEHDCYPPSAASYEKFKRELVDVDGNPYVDLPSGETFRWISYTVYERNNYVLVIQALDHEGTLIKATADGFRMGR